MLGVDPGAAGWRTGSPPRSRDRSLPQDSDLDLQRGQGHSLRGSRSRAAGVLAAGQRSAGLQAGGPPGEERREGRRASVLSGASRGADPGPEHLGGRAGVWGRRRDAHGGAFQGWAPGCAGPGLALGGTEGWRGARPGAGALGPAGSENMRACWALRARHRGGRRLRRPSRSTGAARTPGRKGRSGPVSSASHAAASRSLPAEASGPRASPKHSSSRRGPALTHFPASPPAEIHAVAEQVRAARRGPNLGPPRPPLPPGRGGGEPEPREGNGGGERRIKEGGRRRVGRDRRGRGGEGREQVGRRGEKERKRKGEKGRRIGRGGVSGRKMEAGDRTPASFPGPRPALEERLKWVKGASAF